MSVCPTRLPLIVFLVSVILHLLAGALTGFVPRGGWDGAVYLHYMQQLASGEGVVGDPYRLVRMTGFLPAIFAVRLGLDPAFLQIFQAACNALTLAAAAALMLRGLLIVGALPAVALPGVGALMLSWPFLVMPVYYPVLSDHLALAIAMLSVWAWAVQRQRTLYLLIFAAVWVMPGLFIAPLALAALPWRKSVALGLTAEATEGYRRILLGLLVLGVAYVSYRLSLLTAVEIKSHPDYFEVGLPQLKVFTIVLVFALLLVAAAVLSRLLASPVLWRTMSVSGVVCGSGVVVAGVVSVFTMIDWGSGFRGPPLFHFILLQASAAPIKPLVAHFLYFGPVFIAALLRAVTIPPRALPAGAFPLYAVLLAYLPILVLGSESRQWMAVFPVAVAFLVLSTTSASAFRLIIPLSIVLCAPVAVLGDLFPQSVSHTDFNGQLYFGRQGPWMSVEAWLVGLGLMLPFLLLLGRMGKRVADGGCGRNPETLSPPKGCPKA